MKILLLCWRDTTHPYGGGSERYLERVGQYLANQGHQVLYQTASYPDATAHETRDGMIFSRAGGRFSVYPRALLKLLAGRFGIGELSGVQAIVDTNNGIPFFARLVANVPVVMLTHHCHREQWPVAGPFLGRLGWFLESQIVPRICARGPWVTVSPASARELHKLGISRRDITVIGNGVDPIPTYQPLPNTGPRRHLITLSRLVPHKQLEHAIAALAEIKATNFGADIVLDIVGSGWWEPELRKYAAKLKVTDRVVFHGQVSESQKHALLARAEIHLMPSRKEGWGLAVIEAAQHEVPTIGYRSSAGLADSIIDGQTGLLADAPSEFAQHLQKLLADTVLRKRLGAAAARRAKLFSWEDTGRQWEELLRRSLAARPAKRN
ncbi:glycosyltransferase family 4 protein [Corynebacterium caspium]|uniref:glycosyltransferase family 4 protein n=1 Tax=Corynebacterium caspium TaxID=234828 RepID=UPI000360199A|nr:glycosyltransferase family 4 protein [Corynebacterium caspium]WKD59959.1 GDP-mannose-dependent alpha-(1-6)-phosphatidylinositol monomannoside mannosyltransferase [Corynebacterium caspium DSM 44850]